ncbi:beta-ketoacyl-[acyl-carrier-protein] synthase family protein [Streptomyces sp. CA-278952]|uniref:beta-ketoacyl-[acyl-carrier-protein] synthase family protein n=1 Tax=unclassified Streptomyces TaxID=2593676 RepID=UPI0022428961|nr:MULTISPECIES: beta-ketoacyl-[acyl-carrier-protein] synthase family protein [unclassified Streptomyces]UZI33124.1 beta-ketoacyl-[acyl-carrier-protein] synthase family protein [Streptomyces sp. VB1]WDG33006.1 beta-ketoacyl-[acyl-carrier-protein] synthase family protein [Streptomyces sp. CA-278952]
MSLPADQGTEAGAGTAIAVTGVGLVTPAGADEHSFWERLCSGHSTARRCEELAGLPVDFACPVDGIDLDEAVGGRSVWRMARFVKLALVAARQAVADAGLDPARWDGSRVGVVLGVGVGGVSVLVDNAAKLAASGPEAVSPLLVPMMIPNAAAGEVAIALKAGGPSLAPATACASGATAVAVARDLLLGGSCDVVVAGGAESVLTPLVVTAFARMGALSTRTGDPAGASRPFAADRDGFVIGEGAAMLVLERESAARARGRRPRALLTGAGSSTDAHHPTAPAPDGYGAQRAVQAALDQAGWAPSDVDHINAHGTSTPLNDAMETALISRLFPHRPPVTAPKGVVGHTLAAAGAIEAVATVLTLERCAIPPIANLDAFPDAFPLDCVTKEPRQQRVETALSHSFGFGGHNVALAFQRA